MLHVAGNANNSTKVCSFSQRNKLFLEQVRIPVGSRKLFLSEICLRTCIYLYILERVLKYYIFVNILSIYVFCVELRQKWPRFKSQLDECIIEVFIKRCN